MTLETSSQILLIIVSTFLSIFLLLCILVLVKALQLMRNIKHIVEKAEKLTDSAESVGTFFRNAAGPVSFARLVTNIVESVSNHNKGKKN